jgi:hypothetical protein
MEIHPAQFQRLPAVPVTKKSKVPNLYEAGREYVEQEAADELNGLKSHRAAAVVVPRVAPAKAHLSVLEAYESSVGDGDPMGVAGQILQNMLGSAKRRLGVDHPLSSSEASEQRVEGARCRERSQLAGEA